MYLQIIFWLWVGFAFLDVVSGFLGWLELRRQDSTTLTKLSGVMLSGGHRSIVTIVGLGYLGVNARARAWFLIWGVLSVAHKAYATWGWWLYYRKLIGKDRWLRKILNGRRQETKT